MKEATATKIHDLKCWPEFYAAIQSGAKRFEVRENDRDFRVGDVLILREWSNDAHVYTGQETWHRVTYMLTGGSFGLAPGFVVMSIEAISPHSVTSDEIWNQR